MNRKMKSVCLPIVLIGMVLCSSCSGKRNANIAGDVSPTTGYTIPSGYNFKFMGLDTNIDNPENDRRSYYKIFIDKVEAGRSSIGLESQGKTFETSLSVNRHLLKVEKYVLDERKKRYVKLNNIDQPKPSFIYFDIPQDKIVIIKLLQDSNTNRAGFTVDYERD